MTPKQKQRLLNIQTKVSELPNCYPADFHFLLSLVKSQEAERGVTVSTLIGYEAGLEDAATSMRSACIEKVKAMRDERLKDLPAFENDDSHKDEADYERAVAFVLDGVITALESLTLQEQEAKQS